MALEQIQEGGENMAQYDAIVVLGAVMRWNAEKKRWDFPTIMEPEEYSGRLVMGKARAIAASHIESEAEKILVTGGSNVHPETGERASRSQELARLIVERYRVSPEKVIPMGTLKASHILGNVENVVNHLKEHDAELKTKRIVILVPRFQYERAKLMFEKNPYFTEHNIKVDWRIVEDVLQDRHPKYEKWVQAVEKSPEADIAQRLEQKGIEDLKKGTYKPKQ